MAKPDGKKNPVAVMMGYLSAERMTPAQRTDRARKAAQARWGKTPRRRAARAKKSRPEPAQALPEANAG